MSIAQCFDKNFEPIPTFGLESINADTFQIIDRTSGTEMCVISTYPEEPISAKDRAEFVLSALHSERVRQQKQRTRKNIKTICYDCGLEYGGISWIETTLPDNIWDLIKPAECHDGGGILCISCIVRRLNKKGLKDIPIWLCGTEPIKVIGGDPSDYLKIIREYAL